MKQEVIDGLSALELPENPLDQLVNHFGERNVAELTGRTRRLIRDSRGRVEYKASAGRCSHAPNQRSRNGTVSSGQEARCDISDAAAMGISLHASNREENRQRRVHVTLSLVGARTSRCRPLAGRIAPIKLSRLSTSYSQRSLAVKSA